MVAALAMCAACSDGTTDVAGSATTSASTTTTTEAAPQPVPSEGCRGDATASAPVTDERRTIDVDGVERWYLLTTPAQPADQEPMALVLDFHGLAEGAQIHTQMSGFTPIAQREGFVVAYPSGTGSPVRWDFSPDENPDLAFVDALIDTLQRDLCIDSTRIYATGLSMGAMFTSALACTRADRIAAIAPVAGILYPDGCDPARPMPVMAIHGTADPILQFNGELGDLTGLVQGSSVASSVSLPPIDLEGAGYPEAVRDWAAHNSCEPTPADTEPVPGVLLRTYDCPPDAPVEFYVVEGGGHAWPGSAFSSSISSIVGPTNMDLAASQLIWDFLRTTRLPTP